MQIMARLFYEFHRFRVVSRAGQPIMVRENAEIGPIISREAAVRQVRNGKDVYTAQKSDAKDLAAGIYVTDPACETPHGPTYFQHFHPGGEHAEFPRGQEGRPRAEAGP